jgi:hypothetical protein
MTKPFLKFMGTEKMKKKKHLQEKSKRSERRVSEFQGDHEEERGWCFVGEI